MKLKIISWIARILIAVILGQTLFFKFTDHPQTVELFSQLGMGALEYKTIGLLELTACVLLLIPKTASSGALLSLGLMVGALFSHVTKLGFEGPMGELGLMAVIAASLSVVVLVLHRKEVPFVGKFFGELKKT